MLLLAVLIILALIGLFMLPNATWASGLFMISMYVLALTYAIFGATLLNDKGLKLKAIKSLKFTQALLGGLIGWGIGMIIIGILFKFEFWPGANQLLIIGLLWVIIAMALNAYFAKHEPELTIGKHAIIHGAIFLILGVLTVTMSNEKVIRFLIKDEATEKALVTEYYEAKKQNEKAAVQQFYKDLNDKLLSQQRKQAGN